MAVGATLHLVWLHDVLEEAGHHVAVADPGYVKLIAHPRCKTDPVDARRLADPLRTNLVPEI